MPAIFILCCFLIFFVSQHCEAVNVFGQNGAVVAIDPPTTTVEDFGLATVRSNRLAVTYTFTDGDGFLRIGAQVVRPNGHTLFRNASVCISVDSTHSWFQSATTTSDSNCVVLWLEWMGDEEYAYRIQKINSAGETLWNDGGLEVCGLTLDAHLRSIETGSLYPAADGGCFVMCMSGNVENIRLFSLDSNGRPTEGWPEDGLEFENENRFTLEPDGFGGLWTLQRSCLNRIRPDGSRMWETQQRFELPDEDFNHGVRGIKRKSDSNLYLLCVNSENTDMKLAEIDTVGQLVSEANLPYSEGIPAWCTDSDDRVYIVMLAQSISKVIQYDPNLEDPLVWGDGRRISFYGEMYDVGIFKMEGNGGTLTIIAFGSEGGHLAYYPIVRGWRINQAGEYMWDHRRDFDSGRARIGSLRSLTTPSGSNWFLWYDETQIRGLGITPEGDEIETGDLIPEGYAMHMPFSGALSNGNFLMGWVDKGSSEMKMQQVNWRGRRQFNSQGMSLGEFDWHDAGAINSLVHSDRIISLTIPSYGPWSMVGSGLYFFDPETRERILRVPWNDGIGISPADFYEQILTGDEDEFAVFTCNTDGESECEIVLTVYNTEGDYLFNSGFDSPEGYPDYIQAGSLPGLGWYMAFSYEGEQNRVCMSVIDNNGSPVREDPIWLDCWRIHKGFEEDGDHVLLASTWNPEDDFSHPHLVRMTGDAEIIGTIDLDPFETPVQMRNGYGFWSLYKTPDGNLWIRFTYYPDPYAGQIQLLDGNYDRLLGENGISSRFIIDNNGGAWLAGRDEDRLLRIRHIDQNGRLIDGWQEDGDLVFQDPDLRLDALAHDPASDGVFILTSKDEQLHAGYIPRTYRVQLVTDSELPVGDIYSSNSPDEIRLYKNYPNPFNSSTTISYSVPSPMRVTLTVHDIQGRKLFTCFDGFRQAGGYNQVLTMPEAASGSYQLRFNAEDRNITRQIILIK